MKETKYVFFNIDININSVSYYDNVKKMLDHLVKGYKIISAVGNKTGVQYFLEKK